MLETHGKNGAPLQATRHARIIERLENGETLSISDLAREWAVSAKTLQRDFEKLLLMLPGQIERAEDNKRFRKSRPARSSSDNEVVIETLESMARSIGGRFYTKAHDLLRQLRSSLSSPYYMRIGVEDVSEKFGLIRQLEEAISDRRLIDFDYRRWYDEAGVLKRYAQVKPLRIVIFEGFWYLLCEHEAVVKKFYLKEIRSCTLHDERFKLDKRVRELAEDSMGIWFDPASEPFEVTLHAAREIAVFFERKPINPKQKLYKLPDGSAEIIIKITNMHEIFGLLGYWLPHLRVIEPQSLKEAFEERISGYLKA